LIPGELIEQGREQTQVFIGPALSVACPDPLAALSESLPAAVLYFKTLIERCILEVLPVEHGPPESATERRRCWPQIGNHIAARSLVGSLGIA